MVAFSSTLIASLTQLAAFLPFPAIALVLVIGLLFGLAQGAVIHFYKAPAFIVTLAGMFLLRGLGFVIDLNAIPVEDPLMVKLSTLGIPLGEKASLSFSACVLILAVVAPAAVLGFTKFGRNVDASGGSELSVLLMGIPLARTKLAIYALSGFFSAAAGVVFTIYKLSGSAAAAMGLELDAIAAAGIGGARAGGGCGGAGGPLTTAATRGVR